MKHIPKLKYWFCGFLVIAVSLIFCNSGHYCLYRDNWIPILLYGLLIPFALAFVEKQSSICTLGNKNLSILLSILFSIFITIGKNYYYGYNWSHCFGTRNSIFLLTLQFIIYSYILYPLILWILGKIETQPLTTSKRAFNSCKWFIRILLVKSIFFLAFFPCIFDFDAALGMRTFIDSNSAICNHHPVFVEAIHALFFKIGSTLGSPTIGFSILSLLFIIVSSFITIYGINLISKTTINNYLFSIVVVIFTLFPVFPYISLLPTKDGLFAYAFLLYILSLFNIYISEGQCLKKKKFLVIYILAICFVCLTRHQGLAIIIISTLALLFTYRKFFLKLFSVSAPSIGFIIFVTTFLYPIWDIEPGGKQEIYGTLFQQTACYLTLHPKDVTVEEKKAITDIIDESVIMNNYEPYITDPIKNEYRYNPRFSDVSKGLRKFRHIDHKEEPMMLSAYLSAWASMGKRHPMAYLQATISLFWGFVYNANYPLLNIYTEGFYNPKANTQEYQFWRIDCVSRFIDEYQPQIMQIPILNWIIAIPYYIWATIFLLAILVYHRDLKLITVFLPLFLSVGVLFICPVVNGRYIFPIVLCLPLLFVAVIISLKQSIIAHKKKDL